MDLSFVPSGPLSSCYIGGFCIYNGGKIIDCFFSGQVNDDVDRFYQGAGYFGIMLWGEIKLINQVGDSEYNV